MRALACDDQPRAIGSPRGIARNFYRRRLAKRVCRENYLFVIGGVIAQQNREQGTTHSTPRPLPGSVLTSDVGAPFRNRCVRSHASASASAIRSRPHKLSNAGLPPMYKNNRKQNHINTLVYKKKKNEKKNRIESGG